MQGSLAVLVANEGQLPAAPQYEVDSIDDPMAVRSRGRLAVGRDAKMLFYDGRPYRQVGHGAV